MATKLKVETKVGTFKRTTVRVYTHIVVVGPRRLERLEAHRLAEIASLKREAERYRRTIATGSDPLSDATEFQRQFTASRIADGSFHKWAESCDRQVLGLTARGPVTADEGEPFVLGWCGRSDLAHKLRASSQAAQYRWAKVFDVATGQEVF